MQKGNTPLLLAVRGKHVVVIRYLLEQAHADANVKDDGMCSSLHVAALLGDAETVKLLLNHNADPMAADKFGKKPIDVAHRVNMFTCFCECCCVT